LPLPFLASQQRLSKQSDAYLPSYMRMKAVVSMTAILGVIGTVFVMGEFTTIGFVDKVLTVADSANTTKQAIQQKEEKPTVSLVASPIAAHAKLATPNNNISLGDPFYIEHGKITSQMPVVVQGKIHAYSIKFSGNGTAKGISFTQLGGRALIIPISKDIADIFGNEIINANEDSKSNATVTFRQISHINATAQTIIGNGAMIFNSNATGKMAFLANTVAMFKQIDNGKNDTYIIRAWEWK
jgi:hypothetical protein